MIVHSVRNELDGTCVARIVHIGSLSDGADTLAARARELGAGA